MNDKDDDTLMDSSESKRLDQQKVLALYKELDIKPITGLYFGKSNCEEPMQACPLSILYLHANPQRRAYWEGQNNYLDAGCMVDPELKKLGFDQVYIDKFQAGYDQRGARMPRKPEFVGPYNDGLAMRKLLIAEGYELR